MFLVFLVDYPANQLSNATYRSIWVKQKVEMATKQYMDGINIDFESVLSLKNSNLLVALVDETARAFRAANPHTQVSSLHSNLAWLFVKNVSILCIMCNLCDSQGL